MQQKRFNYTDTKTHHPAGILNLRFHTELYYFVGEDKITKAVVDRNNTALQKALDTFVVATSHKAEIFLHHRLKRNNHRGRTS